MPSPKRKSQTKTKRKAPARPKNSATVWSLQDAKNSFSAVVEAAQQEPQTVTKHGRRTAVVMAAEEFDRLKAAEGRPAKTFVEHLLDMPQDDGEFERIPFKIRDIEF